MCSFFLWKPNIWRYVFLSFRSFLATAKSNYSPSFTQHPAVEKLIFVLWCAVKVWILHKCTLPNVGSPCLFITKSLSHTLLTLGHSLCPTRAHTVLKKTDRDSYAPLEFGQSCLSAVVCSLSLFPCPAGAPVPPPHWAPALGPAVKRITPTPVRGGAPRPHHLALDAP